MKAYVKAWLAVIDPKIVEIHDEVGLRGLNAFSSDWS